MNTTIAFASNGFCYTGVVTYYLSSLCVSYPQSICGCLGFLCVMLRYPISLTSIYYFWFAQSFLVKVLQNYHDEDKLCRIVTNGGFVAKGNPSHEAQCITFILLSHVCLLIRVTNKRGVSIKDIKKDPKLYSFYCYMFYYVIMSVSLLLLLYVTGNDYPSHIVYGVVYGIVFTVLCQTFLYMFVYRSFYLLRYIYPFSLLIMDDFDKFFDE